MKYIIQLLPRDMLWKKGTIKGKDISFAVGFIVQVSLHDVDTTKADGKILTLIVAEGFQKKGQEQFYVSFSL